jgi:hypothetical protein
VTVTEYSAGIVYLTVALAALAVVAVSLRRRVLPGWSGAPARLVEVVFGVATLVVASEALGSFTALSAPALLAALLASAALAWRMGRAIPRTPARPLRAPTARRHSAILALSVLAATFLHWSSAVQESLDFGIYRQDSTWYHLPLAATIFQTGDTWALRFTDPMALTAWFYPQNAELLHAVGMLALGSDFLSPFLNLGWLGLAFLGAWCLGRPFGLGPEVAIAAALVLGAEMMQVQAGNAPNDVAGIALLLASIAILVNAAGVAQGRGSGAPGSGRLRRGALLVAGFAAGLALGTKITLLVPVAVLTIGVAWLERGARLRALGAWLAGLLITGSYWYLRNLAHAGNPLPWISTGPLPTPNQVSLYPRPPRSVADYATEPDVWIHQFAPALADAIGALWPVVLAAAAGGLLLATLRGPRLQRVVGLAGIAAGIAYVFIPVSASGIAGHPSGFATNLRYLAPALLVGLVLLPLQANRWGPRSGLLAATLAAIFAVDALSSWGWPSSPGPGLMLALLLALALLLLATGVRRRVNMAALGVTALLVLAALGYLGERDYLQARYSPELIPPSGSPGFRGSPQWRRLQGWAGHVHHVRIGIVGPPGAFGQYVFYDAKLTNRVLYVGEPGPHGALRPIADCASWRRAINRNGLNFVVVTPAASFGLRSIPEESVWLQGDPHATKILAAAPAAIYRIDGDLDPNACDPRRLPPLLAVPGGGVTILPTNGR